ncbi:MAG: GNAT family N-acetyltransferase [Chloroflexi bacterium]|nr:GNAT family N-acetyltransferase [Chloroflexota bacterium]
MNTFQIRPVNKEDRAWVASLLAEHWGSARMITRGNVYQGDELPGFVAVKDGKLVGLITYRMDGNEWEIGSMNSLMEGIGIGSALVEATKHVAVSAKCRRLWLITTNENLKALRFWQKRGFALAAVYPKAVEASRKLKPEIPLIGNDGIPIRDEIELEMLL